MGSFLSLLLTGRLEVQRQPSPLNWVVYSLSGLSAQLRIRNGKSQTLLNWLGESLGSLLPFCLDRVGKKHSAYKCSRPRFGCSRCIWTRSLHLDACGCALSAAACYQILLPSVTLSGFRSTHVCFISRKSI